jgi:hypothetical protein
MKREALLASTVIHLTEQKAFVCLNN